jgi:sugar lactone lactonase YvrE
LEPNVSRYEIVARPDTDQLGEGPYWDVEGQVLYWADIVKRRGFRFDPSSGEVKRWDMPSVCSAVVPTTRGDLIATLADGVYRLDPATGETRLFTHADPDPRNRSNDTRTDPQGRLILGTMFNNIGPNGEDLPIEASIGGLFCVDGEGRSTRLLSDIGITNSLGFSPNGKRMYFSDTLVNAIWSFAYDPDGPRLSDHRVLNEAAPGNADGSAVDEEGCLWNARWGAGRVIRFTPDGRIDLEIEVPAENPSCCAFGGADRKTLYITSARQGLENPNPDSLDGCLFAVQVDTPGLAHPRFNG